MTHEDGAAASLTRRSRAPLLGDLRILFLGIWGFLRQCVLTFGRTAKEAKERHDLDSGR
jgi:hypothetical protein